VDKKDRIVRVLRTVMPLIALLTVVIIAPLDLVLPWITPLPDTVQEEIDQALDYGLDGIIVYVDQGGISPEFYTAGWKNKLTQEPADPHALFKIGSINKLYIATAIAKLVSKGSLSLEDTLADHFPELVGRIEYADQITLRMLVQHRSGIPNFTDNSNWDWFTPQTDQTKNLELVLDQPADFKPDTKYSYSNTNYLLLARIIDQVLGYSHSEYIENEILTPLELTNTYTTLDQADYDNVVSGYWYGYDDDLRFLDNWMVATAEDVGIFLRALNGGSLLNDDEQAIYSSIYEYGHTGWLPGYYSIARYHADIDAIVVQFVSTTGGETWGLANVIGGKATGLSNIVYNRIVRILHRQ
jgi:D-alanyl-D-alanine carboxypeptidase